MSEQSKVPGADAPGTGEHDQRPPRVADASKLIEVAAGVWVLPDHERTPHVPNVGIVVGERAALVVESGMGIENGQRVLEIARGLAGERRLFLTASHFHPEHGLGAQAFAGEATIVYNDAQWDEMQEKGRRYVDLFSTFTPAIAAALQGVELVAPDIVYGDFARLDLGGRTVHLFQHGDGHTRGDQVAFLPAEGVVFTGDLVEERFFTIMDDGDAHGEIWIRRLGELSELEPQVVVPGHGALGGADLIATVEDSLVTLRDRTLGLLSAGVPADSAVAKAAAETLARYPDWGNREWVEAAARNFLGLPPGLH